ncbi:MAG TPA: glycosyltransferase [Ktedonobacteraceae bacterium]
MVGKFLKAQILWKWLGRKTHYAGVGVKRQGYRVLMVTGIYPTERRPHAGTFIRPVVEALREQGHTVDLLHPGPAPAPLRYLWAALLVFLKTLGGRYDIVHGHYGLWCLAARLQWRAAVVSAFLGDDLLGTITSNGNYSKKSLLVVRISRWLCRVSDAATVKSEQMRQAADCASVVVIPDGIDFTHFYPLPRDQMRALLGWDQNTYYVLFANNPAIPVKNVALARSALQQLAIRGINAELIVMYGQPQEQVMRAMNASNVLILTSLAEGAPNVVKEAMACNIPVVATNVGDVAQVLGQTAGCFVCSHNPGELVEALEDALRYTEPTTGRRDSAHLASTVVVERVLELYCQALEHKRSPQKPRLRKRLAL